MLTGTMEYFPEQGDALQMEHLMGEPKNESSDNVEIAEVII